jgi:hypothetical protein
MKGEKLREAMYNIQWYNQPKPIQRAILMMLIRSKKSLKLTGCGIQSLSFEGLGEVPIVS